MTDPPASGCRTCKGHGTVQQTLVFWLPILRVKARGRGGGRAVWGCVHQEEDGAVEMGFGKKIEWAAIWGAWHRLSR